MDGRRDESGISEAGFRRLILLILLFACVLAYANTLTGEWVWDDASSVLLHKHVQDPGQFVQLFREDQHAFGRGQGNFYRPLVSASFMLDYQLAGGPAPTPSGTVKEADLSTLIFHVTNIFWHAAAALLFALMLRGLGAPRFVQLLAPLIFAVHPLHTEAVAYISGRADMMSAAAIFGAVCFVILSFREEKLLWGLAGASACFVGGLLSKESTLIFPFLLALLLPLMRENANVLEQQEKPSFLLALVPLAPAAVILGVYMLLRATVLRFAEGSASTPSPLSQRLVETAQALGMYVKLLFIPTGLHMERVLHDVSMVYALAGVVFLAGMLAVIVVSLRKGRGRIAAGCAWFLVSWLPISGIFPLNAPMAEHWMYVPMAGFWWAFTELIHAACRRKTLLRAAGVVLVAVCIVFTGLTARRNLDWHDNVTLFRATLRENPESARVHYNLAVTYEDLEGNYAGARRHYERYLELQTRCRASLPEGAPVAMDDEIEARMSLGRVLMRLQAYEEAVNAFAPLIRLSGVEAWKMTAAVAAFETGKAMLALGEVGKANMFFQQAVGMEPRLLTDVVNTISGKPFQDGY